MCANVIQNNVPKYSAIGLSFIGAVMFWSFNVLQSNYKTKISVKVEYSFLKKKDSLAFIHRPDNDVNIELSGRGWDLIKHSVGYFDESVKFEIANPTKRKSIDKTALLDKINAYLDDVDVLRIVDDTIRYDIQPVNIKFLYFSINKDSLNKSLKEWGQNNISKILLSTKKGSILGPKNALDTINSSISMVLMPPDTTQIGKTAEQTLSLTNIYNEKYFNIKPKQVTATIYFKNE